MQNQVCNVNNTLVFHSDTNTSELKANRAI